MFVFLLNIYSKKDDNLRVKELLNTVSGRLLEHVKENPHFWLNNGSIAMVLLGILKSGSGNLITINLFQIFFFLLPHLILY